MGVRVKNIFYHSSQPWPFPCSLMLGFTAEAEGEAVRLGDKELEDARWFSRGELQQCGGGRDIAASVDRFHSLSLD